MYLFYILNFLFFITSSSSEKFCVNCKFFVKHPYNKSTFGKCSAFRKNLDNYQLLDYLVSGKQKIEYKFCSTARENDNLCGKEGKMYIEKNNFFLSLQKKEKENNINIL